MFLHHYTYRKSYRKSNQPLIGTAYIKKRRIGSFGRKSNQPLIGTANYESDIKTRKLAKYGLWSKTEFMP